MNGSPVGFFQASRGLKQGDPLSPFLFILLLESFSRRLNRQVREGFIQPYILPRGSPLITHLAFADDLILFTRGSRQSLRHLFAFLGDYEAASGQKINKEKSTFLTSKRSSLTQNRVISSLTGLHHSSFPLKYLGCMIFKGRKRVSHFHHLVDKVDARLTGWMSNFLSMAGRLILINHVLAAIPLHVLAALDPPKQILQQIESKFARFFWGTSESQMKRHWCSWDRVARPKAENGLAVRKLEDVALSFACKKWWKLINRSGIWAEFISSRLLSPWHFAVTGRMATVRSIMLQHSRILVLDGSCSFWYQNWSGLGLLVDKIPFFLPAPPPLVLHDVYPNGIWERPDLDYLFQPEVLSLLQSQHFQYTTGTDKFFWEPSSTGQFSLSSAFSSVLLDSSIHF